MACIADHVVYDCCWGYVSRYIMTVRRSHPWCLAFTLKILRFSASRLFSLRCKRKLQLST